MEDARNALKKYEGGCGDPMPWETDEDLLDLKPLEILDCVADELTFAQRAKLHELCIEEMKDELKGKTQKYIELLDEFNAAKKEQNVNENSKSSFFKRRKAQHHRRSKSLGKVGQNILSCIAQLKS